MCSPLFCVCIIYAIHLYMIYMYDISLNMRMCNFSRSYVVPNITSDLKGAVNVMGYIQSNIPFLLKVFKEDNLQTSTNPSVKVRVTCSPLTQQRLYKFDDDSKNYQITIRFSYIFFFQQLKDSQMNTNRFKRRHGCYKNIFKECNTDADCGCHIKCMRTMKNDRIVKRCIAPTYPLIR